MDVQTRHANGGTWRNHPSLINLSIMEVQRLGRRGPLRASRNTVCMAQSFLDASTQIRQLFENGKGGKCVALRHYSLELGLDFAQDVGCI